MGYLYASRDGRYGAASRLVVALLLSFVLHFLLFCAGFIGGVEGGYPKGRGQIQKLSIVVKVNGSPGVGAKRLREAEVERGDSDRSSTGGGGRKNLEDGRGEKMLERDPVNDPEGPEYFPGHLLTKSPYPLTDLEEPGSDRLGSVQLDGRALLRVWINAQGRVDNVALIYSDMPEVVYEETVAAYRQMRFSPAEIAGKSVACVMEIEVSFEDFRLKIGD